MLVATKGETDRLSLRNKFAAGTQLEVCCLSATVTAFRHPELKTLHPGWLHECLSHKSTNVLSRSTRTCSSSKANWCGEVEKGVVGLACSCQAKVAHWCVDELRCRLSTLDADPRVIEKDFIMVALDEVMFPNCLSGSVWLINTERSWSMCIKFVRLLEAVAAVLATGDNIFDCDGVLMDYSSFRRV